MLLMELVKKSNLMMSRVMTKLVKKKKSNLMISRVMTKLVKKKKKSKLMISIPQT